MKSNMIGRQVIFNMVGRSIPSEIIDQRVRDGKGQYLLRPEQASGDYWVGAEDFTFQTESEQNVAVHDRNTLSMMKSMMGRR